MHMKLKTYMSSCHLYCLNDWMKCVDWAKDHAFTGVELFGGENECRFENMDMERLVEISDHARKSGIELSCHPWVNWENIEEDEMTRLYLETAERCAKMGMTYLNMHIHFLTDRKQGMDRLFRATDKVLPIIEKANMILLYENVPSHGKRDMGSEYIDFEKLFNYYPENSPVQMNIDTGHAHIHGMLEPLAEDFASRWAYTHINDNFGLHDDHVAPGDGTLDFGLVARASKEAGYTGPLMMEFHEMGMEKGMKVLSEAYGKYGYTLL